LAVENISAGYHTLAEAFSGWRDSPPHKANMPKNGVTKLGIAASYAPNTKYKVFWTLILASSETGYPGGALCRLRRGLTASRTDATLRSFLLWTTNCSGFLYRSYDIRSAVMTDHSNP